MISFIIIGRNEGERLVKCIKSIHKSTRENNISDFEIIYVDSNSTDNTVQLVSQFNDVKIFVVEGKTNAPIGRNIGARESKGDIMFFIDGDMEIIPEFLPLIFVEESKLNYPFLSGQFENYYYDNEGNLTGKELYHKSVLKEDKYQTTTGGLFIIERKYWEKLGGMNTKYRTAEDLDLGMRMARMGIKLLRKKELLAIHNTVHYQDKKRMWKDLLRGLFSFRGVLYREHVFNPHIYKRIAKSDPTMVLFAVSLVMSVILCAYMPLIAYLAVLLLAILFKLKTLNPIAIVNRYFHQLFRDVNVFLAMIFFYPSNLKEYHYKTVKA